MTDPIDDAMQRNDAIDVLSRAIYSVKEPGAHAAEVLRNIEEGGYTLRLTTREERAARRAALETEMFGTPEARP